jgi:hydrogenase maturation protein HypF
MPIERRWRAAIRGMVQGVGFRPAVYRLALRVGVGGWVQNGGEGVELEVQGPDEAVEAFRRLLPGAFPPRAQVAQVRWEAVAPGETGAFRIRESSLRGIAAVPPADLALCSACRRELEDPGDRRHGYPFINCVDCGPRFTILRSLPYDRERTSMAAFPLCPDCAREYADPLDRRHHAEPVACPACGPRLCFNGEPLSAAAAIARATALLTTGGILALKGLGGFHLACDAADPVAVRRLRERKGRPDKPLAVMAADLASARRLVEVDEAARIALEGPAAPIVLLPRRPEGPVAEAVAPGRSRLGVLLAYTPLHHLLLRAVDRPLVMTSGNRSGQPIAYRNAPEAELAALAEGVLDHDREICQPCDDSVAMPDPAGEGIVLLRRSRGFVPLPLDLPEGGEVLAVGAQRKSTFCLTRGREAFLSQHLGDLEEESSFERYRQLLARWEDLLEVRPRVVAHDLHPDYPSTRFARRLPGARRVAVQHHHAHIVAAMVEHRLAGPVLGIACDGSGYGTDGTVWGGEFLLAGYGGFRRVGRLRTVPLPGGDAAVRHPRRMALSFLTALYGERLPPLAFLEQLAPGERETILEMLRRGVRSPLTSSCGRLCDAVAAILGGPDPVSYEGQAAAELEEASEETAAGYDAPTGEEGELLVADPLPLVAGVVEDLERGVFRGRIGGRFHRGLAGLLARTGARAASLAGLGEVVLAGGVFQNRLLLRYVAEFLEREGLRVFYPRQVPPGDGSISLGQAAVALRILREEKADG